jgi:transcriptional regulator with XRE-family HTH domain
MVYYMLKYYLPFKQLINSHGLSERDLAEKAGISRGALRSLCQPEHNNATLSTISSLANYFDGVVEVSLTSKESFSEYSSIATSMKIERDGFDSWKIHLFDFVDEFRRTLDPRLIILPPQQSLHISLKALLASVVVDLSNEEQMNSPLWALKRYFLKTPWFVSGMNSLKATAIVESPLPYRANNIFVHANFLSRL